MGQDIVEEGRGYSEKVLIQGRQKKATDERENQDENIYHEGQGTSGDQIDKQGIEKRKGQKPKEDKGMRTQSSA